MSQRSAPPASQREEPPTCASQAFWARRSPTKRSWSSDFGTAIKGMRRALGTSEGRASTSLP
eukprot:1063548-Alexandrium_andersonii.AAC.1